MSSRTSTWTCLFALALVVECHHSSLAQIDPVELREDLSAGNFESLQRLRAADADAALPVIRGYVLGKRETISEPALEAIRKVPNIVQWVGDDLQKRISPGRLDFTVDEDFELLGRLRTSEAVREIGRHINNNSILKSPSDDLGSQMVSVSASLSLCLVGFSNAPTPNLWWMGGLGKPELERWQIWWKENGANIEELVKEASVRPPPPPGKLQLPQAHEAKTPKASSQSSSQTPQLTTSRAPKEVSDVSRPESPSMLPWLIGIVVIAAIIIGAVMMRRKA